MTASRVALAWSFAERYASLIIGVSTSMIIARLLTPAQIGLFSLCSASIAIAGTIRDFGVGEYLLKEKILNEEKLRAAFAVALTTAWGIGTVIYFGRNIIADYFKEADIASLLAVLSLNFLILPFASPAYALFSREMAFRRIFAIQMVVLVAQSGTSIILAWMQYGPYSLAWASVVGVSIQVIMVTAMRPKASLVWPLFRGAREIFGFGGYQVSARLIDTITANAHEFIIANSFGFSGVGFFSRAKGLVDMFHSNITFAITRVAAPAMATVHRADNSLVQIYTRGTAIFTSLSWPFFGLIAIIAPEVVFVILGPQWERSGSIARLLAISALPTALFALGTSVLSATGKVKIRLRLTLQWCPFHIAVLLIAGNISLEAMAISWGITNILIAALYAKAISNLLEVKIYTLFAPSIASIWVAAATVGVGFAVALLARAQGAPAIVLMVVVSACAALAWLMIAGAVRHPAFEEVMRVLRSLAARR